MARSQGQGLVCMIQTQFTKRTSAPADNHQFPVTPASNYGNIELCDMQPCACDNLLSEGKECVTGDGDNPELNLNWMPSLTACLCHGQWGRAGRWAGHSPRMSQQGPGDGHK